MSLREKSKKASGNGLGVVSRYRISGIWAVPEPGRDERASANSDGSKPELPALNLGLSYHQLQMKLKLSVTRREPLLASARNIQSCTDGLLCIRHSSIVIHHSNICRLERRVLG